MTREEMIDALVEDDLNFSGAHGNINYQYMAETLRMGFVGYDNWPDHQLLEECQYRNIDTKETNHA